jgi:thiosulfate dehydrogenase (quinone) large subunit
MQDARGSQWPLVAITLLRVVVGWHFLYEGIAKLTSASWSAAGYLRQARGPFAGLFRWIASQPNMLANADLITMWGLTIVGVLLILGLFTRLASVAGIAFILLFYFANPPFVGYFYSLPS